MKNILFIIIAALLIIPVQLSYALEVPVLQGRVNDYGDMISPETESLLEERLKSFELSDSTQIVILTVNSLEGDAMEDFTIRVAEKWKIGQTKKDNGVILFASKNDRRMRIEVGRGLEGVLTDLLSGRILDNVIRPRFKAGDFDGGFIDGTASIIDACRGEFKNDSVKTDSADSGSPIEKYMIFILAILYIAILVVSQFSKILSGGIGALSLPSIIYFGFSPMGFIEVLIFACIGFVVALILPYIPIGGGSSSGGSGGSSGGSSSFGGGGGSFGGGGSSGGW
ncbi:MAG: methanol dehydrogenase [Spirochaetae bacterium HGW-Spirochaetae-5]|nr:MAG: methanol dehydrogenase [Spirochaetae bacterium HGW-Spirochaetae-5]